MDELDFDDRERMLQILNAWYPRQGGWQINEKLIHAFLKMADELNNCTATMHWVPRPLNPFGNPIKQMGKEAFKRLLRSLDETKHYKVCMQRVKSAYQSQLEWTQY